VTDIDDDERRASRLPSHVGSSYKDTDITPAAVSCGPSAAGSRASVVFAYKMLKVKSAMPHARGVLVLVLVSSVKSVTPCDARTTLTFPVVGHTALRV